MQQQMLGVSGGSGGVSITDSTLYGAGLLSVEPGYSQISLLSTGQFRTSETTGDGAGGVTIIDKAGEWLVTGLNSDYEARATIISGTVTGTTGTWLVLSTTRTWTKTKAATPIGSIAVSFTLEIRNASTLVVLDTATISLTAEVL